MEVFMAKRVLSLAALLIAIGFIAMTLGCTNSPGGESKNSAGRFGLSPQSTSLGAIYSGVPWLDTSGNLVNAHGVGFIKVGSTYYMVGEQRSGKNDTYAGSSGNYEDQYTGVNMYSTSDFINWTYIGNVQPPQSGTYIYPPACGERPKILYCAATGKYLIYTKMMDYTGSEIIHFSVATSSTIGGTYTYVGELSTTKIGDFNMWMEGTTGYFCDCDGYLYQLSSDYQSIASTVKTGIQAGEGTSLYKAGSTYFWQSSQKSGWRANDNSYSTATSLSGTWTSHGYFCPSGTQTWQSQDTSVVPIAGSSGTTYLYVGDRWAGGNLPASTLVMQPLSVSGSTESISTYYPAWNLNVGAGTWSSASISGTSTSISWSSGTSNDTYTYAFTGTQIFLYGTFSSASGMMAVAILNSSGTVLNDEVPVSCYSSGSTSTSYLLYVSPVMSSGNYTLRVRALGRKAISSSSSTVTLSKVVVSGGSSSTPTPTPTSTPTPTVTPTPTGTPTPTPTPGGGIVSGNIYKLTCVMSSKNLDNYNHGTNGQWVGQYTAGTGTTQQWKITANGSYYTLVNQQSGMALDNGNTSTSGAHVMQWTANGGSAQNWQIVNVSGNIYTLKSQMSGLMMDNGNSTANGQTVIQSTATGGTTQQWTIQ
jgi:hypothetical protein